MKNIKTSIDLSQQELGVIEAALRTQEKILSVQSRANGDATAQARLSELRAVLKTLDPHLVMPPQAPAQSEGQGWGSMARAFFS